MGCGDGPASFNAEATRRGGQVTSVDPLYAFGGVDIQARTTVTYDEILGQLRNNLDDYVWDTIRSVEQLGQVRLAAMQDFLADYDHGRADGRYVDASVVALTFPDVAFDLAVCSHFLFLYSSQFGQDFHLTAMCRVATEVRVFPIVSLDGRQSPYVEECSADLEKSGFDTVIETVPYEFQRGANQMMRVRPRNGGRHDRRRLPAPRRRPEHPAGGRDSAATRGPAAHFRHRSCADHRTVASRGGDNGPGNRPRSDEPRPPGTGLTLLRSAGWD